MSDQNTDYNDTKIDALLAARSVEATPDFVERTLKRLKDEIGLIENDDKLDQLLADHPISTSSEFIDDTLNKVRNVKKTRFLSALQSIAAAAVIVVTFLTLYFVNSKQTDGDIGSQVDATKVLLPSQFVIDDRDEPTMNELFVLAESLSDVNFLLDNNTFETLEIFIQ